MTETENTFINLIAYAIFKKEFTKKEIDFKEVLKLAKKHNVYCIVYRALTSIYTRDELASVLPFAEKKNYEFVAQNMSQQAEFNHIIDIFKEQKLDFLNIKGMWVKNFYEYDYERSMGDADFLIFSKNKKQFRNIMKDEGYLCKNSNHGHYQKDNFHIELHTFLDEKNCDINDKNSVHFDGWQFKNTITHLIKHLPTGTGIRMYLDVAIICDKLKDKLDFDYLKTEFEKEGILDICQYIMALNERWFGVKNMLGNALIVPSTLDELEKQVVTEGIFGYSQKENRYRGVILRFFNTKKKNKFALALSLLFPPFKVMRDYYFPSLKKVPFMLPIYWIVRIIKFIFQKKDLKALFKAMDSVDEKETIK